MPRKTKEPKLTQTPKNNEEVQNGLMEIYANSDGSLPDISHLDVKRSGYFKFLLVSSLVVAALLMAIAWLGFLIFSPGQDDSARSLDISIDAPIDVSSGDEVAYAISYKNNEAVALKDVEIIVRYPEGFTYVSADRDSSNEHNTTWNIGDLAAGQSGTITIKGTIIGQIGDVKVFNVTFSFQPENFSSRFKESESFNTQVTSSIIGVELNGPDQIQPEKEATYKLTYTNNSEKTLEAIKVIASYPKGFVYKQSEPKPKKQENSEREVNNEWLIENVEPGESGTIEIVGGYLKNTEETQAEMFIQVGFINENNDFSLQQEVRYVTEILVPDINGNIIVNGLSTDQPISYGEVLQYSLVYKNVGSKNLEDVVIMLKLNGDIVDWDSLEDKNKGLVKADTIQWSAKEISGLSTLRPLDEGTINFTIKVKESDNIKSDGNLQLISTMSASIKKVGDVEVSGLVVELAELKNNINTDVEFTAGGRYFDDDNIAVGSGPLPPVVGEKTTFRIYWTVANNLNKIEDVVVSAKLPKGVQWTGKTFADEGDLDYNASSNVVEWSISSLASNANGQTNAWFDISITPSSEQVKKILILTEQSVMTATDNVTEAFIRKISGAITTNLEGDPIGGGNGVVVDISQ